MIFFVEELVQNGCGASRSLINGERFLVYGGAPSRTLCTFEELVQDGCGTKGFWSMAVRQAAPFALLEKLANNGIGGEGFWTIGGSQRRSLFAFEGDSFDLS